MIAAETGIFSITSALTDGENRFTAIATNVKGESSKSDSFTLAIDTLSPDATVIDNISNDGTTISGTAEAGSTVSIYDLKLTFHRVISPLFIPASTRW